jgi:GT2 family glycosyltransferase
VGIPTIVTTNGDVPLVTVIVVNWNTRDLVLDCLASVAATLPPLSAEVWLVDNGSVDGSVAAVRERFPGVRIIANSDNLGFAAANNQALRRVRSQFALLLNSDAVLTEGAVQRLVAFMQGHEKAAAVCGQLLNPDGSRQNSTANFPSIIGLLTNESLMRILFPRRYPSKRRAIAEPIEVDSCIGACMLVRKTAMDAIGLLDERYFFFMEETDWALRMRREGWQVWFVPDARVIHGQGQSAGSGLASRKLFYRSRYRYFKKWYPRTYPFVAAVIFSRLAVNAILSGAGVLLTLGLNRSLRDKTGVYRRLITWHLSGCR